MVQKLPNNIEECHEVIQELAQEVAVLRKHLFGRKTEKRPVEEYDGSQLDLFAPQPEATEEEIAEETSEPKHAPAKKKRGRQPLPEDLPREEIVFDVEPEDKICSCCGCEKARIGEDVTEQLELIPATMYVMRTVRPKYACSKCRDGVVQKPLPAQPIPRGIAGPGLLAWIVVAKYADHIPLCRMERMFARHGIDLARSRTSSWMMELAGLCKPLIGLMHKRILGSFVINSDDTQILVQEPGGSKRCYIWVYLGDAGHPYTLYDFRRSRSREGPREILATYNGNLQADAYSGYDNLFLPSPAGKPSSILELGCWAHARRKFVEAGDAGDPLAGPAVAMARELYGIEKKARNDNMAPDDIAALRQAQSVPVLDKFEAWTTDRIDVLPKSPLGKAIGYAQNNWTALRRYTEDGRFAIDNNAAERAIRPVAVGRKNWLFAGSERGGRAAATFFTLLESARRNGLNPYDYLRDVFTRLPAHPINRLDEFLPDQWEPGGRPA